MTQDRVDIIAAKGRQISISIKDILSNNQEPISVADGLFAIVDGVSIAIDMLAGIADCESKELKKFLYKALGVIKDYCNEEWEKGRAGYLTFNNMVFALIKVIDDISTLELISYVP